MTAQAAATSMQIQSAALAKNQGLIAYEWVKKWKGDTPSVVMGSSAGTMVNLTDLMKTKGE